MALLRAHLWPLAAAVLVGFALLPIVEREYVSWRNSAHQDQQRAMPVVRMTGELVRREGMEVWIHIRGAKLRDCRFGGLTAYAIDGGVRRDANIERADGIAVTGSTKPIGTYDIGVWRIWPVHGSADTVLVAVEHICDGVAIRSVIAEVPL